MEILTLTTIDTLHNLIRILNKEIKSKERNYDFADIYTRTLRAAAMI